MPVTIFTVLWAILGCISVLGLYFFNHGRGFFVFITSRKYLVLLIVAAVLGMRQEHFIALMILSASLVFMYRDYFPYMATCRRLKKLQERK